MPGWAPPHRYGTTSPFASLVTDINDAKAEYFVTMSLRNACVTFFPERDTRYRSQFVSRDGVTAVLHGFSEYDMGYRRLATVRPERPQDQTSLAACERRSIGLAVPMSSNNIYHQAFHAVPAWETLRAHTAADATLIPLVFSNAAFGRGSKPIKPRRWFAWEFTVRALSQASSSALLAATQALVEARCTCFDRVEADASAFNPSARGAASRLQAFRARALYNNAAANGVVDRIARRSLLFVSRVGARRVATNEALLLSRLQAATARVQRVVLEELPFAEQMSLVASSAGLIAVHGQALAWMLFLPTESARTAVIEILISSRHRNRINDCYQDWAASLQVKYFRVRSEASVCPATDKRRSKVNPLQLLNECNVTVDADRLLGIVRLADAWTAGTEGG